MKEITAKEGAWLTQTATLEDESGRIFVKKVMTPNVDLWRDASNEEKVAWEEAHPIEPTLNEEE